MREFFYHRYYRQIAAGGGLGAGDLRELAQQPNFKQVIREVRELVIDVLDHTQVYCLLPEIVHLVHDTAEQWLTEQRIPDGATDLLNAFGGDAWIEFDHIAFQGGSLLIKAIWITHMPVMKPGKEHEWQVHLIQDPEHVRVYLWDGQYWRISMNECQATDCFLPTEERAAAPGSLAACHCAHAVRGWMLMLTALAVALRGQLIEAKAEVRVGRRGVAQTRRERLQPLTGNVRVLHLSKHVVYERPSTPPAHRDEWRDYDHPRHLIVERTRILDPARNPRWTTYKESHEVFIGTYYPSLHPSVTLVDY